MFVPSEWGHLQNCGTGVGGGLSKVPIGWPLPISMGFPVALLGGGSSEQQLYPSRATMLIPHITLGHHGKLKWQHPSPQLSWEPHKNDLKCGQGR